MNLTWEQVRGRLEIPSPYFLSRGYSPAILDQFDIGESAKQQKAVVPIYDDDGTTCVGFISRSIQPYCLKCQMHHLPNDCSSRFETRWEVMRGFPKGQWLFNYAAARSSAFPCVLVVEGAPDVLRAAEAGVPAVALLGSDSTGEQVRKLASLNKLLVVALDNDCPGGKGAATLMGRLKRQGVPAESHRPPSGYKDVGEMSPPDVVRWLDRFFPNDTPGSGLTSARRKSLPCQGQIVESPGLGLSP